ncbi:MAG: DUF1549 domain-containing protein [Prosthecobacter sp.]|nr:DUF1549 domain-containing protein [Prosthecobacter sp.]
MPSRLWMLILACHLISMAGLHAAADPATTAREIDSLLAADWQKHRLQANAPASDDTFVRRIHLDLVGRIPTYRETVEFLADKSPNKRANLIDRLLASEGYTLHLFNYWSDILRVLSKGTYPGDAGRVTGTAYAEYIKDSIRSNKPYDQFVRELVSAHGQVWDNGAIGYYQRDRGMPLDNIATTTRIFLGTRIECAQCHNHPFDKWTQMQFHQIAAYTYGVQTTMATYSPPFYGMLDLARKRREKAGISADDEVHLRQAYNEIVVPIKHVDVSYRAQSLRLPHDYQYKDAAPKSLVTPATLMGAKAEFSAKGNPLNSFADWLASPDNPRFTTVIANRLWKKLFGLGLIEPVDDLNDTIPASNPALMAHLEKVMRENRYDTKAFIRILCNTQAYQREVTRTEWPAGQPYPFTGPLLRRMTAEQIWDSFTTLINAQPDLPNLELRKQTDTFLANARKLGEAIDNLSPEELLQRADITSEIFRTNAARFKELQKQIAEARAREDKAQVGKFARELGALRKTEIRTANDNIYVPAILKLSSAARQPSGSVDYKDIEVPGFMPKDRSFEEQQQTAIFLAEAELKHFPTAQQESYLTFRRAMMRLWPRAAELESPAPPGHALREFGQSDRESVENANDAASVPQALVLMNGQMMTNILNSWSQLMLAVNRTAKPEDRLGTIYLTLLSRQPTPREQAAWTTAQANGLTKEDLIYALLNSQQFIFVQ